MSMDRRLPWAGQAHGASHAGIIMVVSQPGPSWPPGLTPRSMVASYPGLW